MIDTSGFYKNDGGSLLFGPNFVESSDYTLRKESHDIYVYPVDGWWWFDDEVTARVALGVPEELPPERPIIPGMPLP